jgi:hypothetical protein
LPNSRKQRERCWWDSRRRSSAPLFAEPSDTSSRRRLTPTLSTELTVVTYPDARHGILNETPALKSPPPCATGSAPTT